MHPFIKKTIPHLSAILIFLLATAIYFHPQIKGKSINANDIVNYKGMAKESRDYQTETGYPPLWTNSMFGGMPTYQINRISQGNYLGTIDKVIRLNIWHPIGRFFAAMIGFYILMLVLGVDHLLAITGAIAFSFTTNNFLLYETGHFSKLNSVSYFPLLIAGLLLAYTRKNYIWGALLFALGLGLNIFSNHIQMTYYLFLTLIIFGGAQLVNDIRKKQLQHFLKATAYLIVAGLLALGSATNNLLVTYEYSKDTIRGKKVLLQDGTSKTGQAGSSSETEGLTWDYAMDWSSGPLELFASFIPGVVGGGSLEKVGKNSPLYDDPNWSRSILQPGGGKGPLYWGNLSFTSGPIYYGAAVFLFFLMGLILVKGPIKWWLGFGVLLTFLLAMGKNLEFFNEFFYNYIPLYNKFRTPNSILTITSFLVPLLGFLALGKIINGQTDKREVMNSLKIGGGLAAGICLFFVLIGPSFFDFTGPGDSQYEESGLNIGPLIEARKYHLRMDALRSLVIILLSGGLIWAHLNEKVKRNLFLGGVALIVIFDLWSVGLRYLDASRFQIPHSGRTYKTNIPLEQADELILGRETNGRGFYRVMDLGVNTFQSSSTSYTHNSIGGYHAAKLQRYQDIIDMYLQPSIVRMDGSGLNSFTAWEDFLAKEPVINMLNTKYLKLNEESTPVVNPHASGNAWFVNTIKMVNSPNEEIEALNGIDPNNTAVIHQEFSDYVSGFSPNKNGTIQLYDYKPDLLTYQSNTNSEQLAVFSEIWYGPEKGWQVYIDNQPVNHIRVNYVLRGLKVPAGQHTIQFEFNPSSYASGLLISKICSLFIIFGLLSFGGYKGYQYFQNMEKVPEEVEKNQVTKERKKLVKPTSKTSKKAPRKGKNK